MFGMLLISEDEGGVRMAGRVLRQAPAARMALPDGSELLLALDPESCQLYLWCSSGEGSAAGAPMRAERADAEEAMEAPAVQRSAPPVEPSSLRTERLEGVWELEGGGGATLALRVEGDALVGDLAGHPRGGAVREMAGDGAARETDLLVGATRNKDLHVRLVLGEGGGRFRGWYSPQEMPDMAC
eukprot:gene12112-14314_t